MFGGKPSPPKQTVEQLKVSNGLQNCFYFVGPCIYSPLLVEQWGNSETYFGRKLKSICAQMATCLLQRIQVFPEFGPDLFQKNKQLDEQPTN